MPINELFEFFLLYSNLFEQIEYDNVDNISSYGGFLITKLSSLFDLDTISNQT